MLSIVNSKMLSTVSKGVRLSVQLTKTVKRPDKQFRFLTNLIERSSSSASRTERHGRYASGSISLWQCDKHYSLQTLIPLVHSNNVRAVHHSETSFFNKDRPITMSVSHDKHSGDTVSNSVYRTAHNVQKALSHNSKLYGDDHVEEIARLLMKAGMPSRDVVNLLISHPEILKNRPEHWHAAIQCLSSLGFTGNKMAPVLAVHTGLFFGDTTQFHASIDALRGLGFRDGKVQDIVSEVPELAAAEPKALVKQFSQLLELFTRPQVLKLLMRCPSLLLEQWSELAKKVEYARSEIGVKEMTSLLHCDLLKHPLLHVRTRHAFLLRSGLYPKASDLSRRNAAALEDVPSLRMVLDTTDSRFARRVAGMPIEEYTTFKELHKREAEEAWCGDEDTDDSDDDFSDNEEQGT